MLDHDLLPGIADTETSAWHDLQYVGRTLVEGQPEQRRQGEINITAPAAAWTCAQGNIFSEETTESVCVYAIICSTNLATPIEDDDSSDDDDDDDSDDDSDEGNVEYTSTCETVARGTERTSCLALQSIARCKSSPRNGMR